MANFYASYPVSGGTVSAGVSSLNALTGALNLIAGSGISVTPSGSSITIAATSGSGTVTSVGLADDTGLFNIIDSPVTGSGTLTLGSLISQGQNLIFAGPASGGPGAPAFRGLHLADLPAIGNNLVLGNISGSSAVPVGLTQTQLTALVDTFTSSLSGAAPASGGGTSNFLRADGTWAAPVAASYTFIDSVQNASGSISLSGDTATPGDSKYYGTDASGTRGWYASVVYGGLTFADSLVNTSGTVTLSGDASNPGASYYYGTNSSGTKGWYTLSLGLGFTYFSSNSSVYGGTLVSYVGSSSAGTTIVGVNAGTNLGNGNSNTFYGYQANIPAASNAYQAVAIGAVAIANSNCIALGYEASATGTNSIAIGSNVSTSTNNQTVIGNSSTTTTLLAGAVQLGLSGTPQHTLFTATATGSGTSTLGTANSPGGTTPAGWISIVINGTTRYIPFF